MLNVQSSWSSHKGQIKWYFKTWKSSKITWNTSKEGQRRDIQVETIYCLLPKTVSSSIRKSWKKVPPWRHQIEEEQSKGVIYDNLPSLRRCDDQT